jgi:lysophospholipase
MATSSDTFSLTCQTLPSTNSSDILIADLEDMLSLLHAGDFRDEFSVYPNPFHGYPGSPAVQNLTELNLEDGGFTLQNDPIWPFIQPARSSVIDVLIVNDNSADTADNFPDGSEIYQTYLRSQQAGLSRMPTIPPPSVFASEGLTKRATFFGCHDKTKLIIIYLPNVAYSFPSNQSTATLVYSAADTDAMIANGVQIATQNGDAQWPTCLGCAIMMNSTLILPEACEACFAKYCFTG